MWVELVRKLRERGVGVEGEGAVVGKGVMKTSFSAGGIRER
jgi:hypothetical protein